MIRRCTDLSAILSVINDAADAYRGVVPDDCLTEPYMSASHLRDDIASGVEFWGSEHEGDLVGVMGIQDKGEVSLIRHAYVRTASRNHGIGSSLLTHLRGLATTPMLVGTWADAGWAVRFYEKHGFRLVTTEEKDRLLARYWSIPDRQIETSVVLGDPAWFSEDRD